MGSERKGTMYDRMKVGTWLLLILAVLSACQGEQPQQPEPPRAELELTIESNAFEMEGNIPKRYTCDGEDVSPPLLWSEPPAGTQSLVLVCDDPDAPSGTWDHWLLFNIPAAVRSLPEGVAAVEVIEGVGVHGTNSWRRLGYGGPCPPEGPAHRYYFKLYALDVALGLDPGAEKQDVEKAMTGHVLAQGQLMARYGR
jgi:Raf kinase inhibitor-like YbhB/YbcL family protein